MQRVVRRRMRGRRRRRGGGFRKKVKETSAGLFKALTVFGPS